MTWEQLLAPIKASDYYKKLWENVELEYANSTCFPPKEQIYRALELTPFDDVKVVIIGQDPYHNDRQANGLSFSVAQEIKAPPSLRNLFKELESDLGVIRTSNDLQDWAKQGVLLLNASLTVRAHEPNSHQHLNWMKLTDAMIQGLSAHKEGIIFVLWGAFAQKKAELIDSASHVILKSPHPSPFSAYRGFFGSRPFSQINEYLKSSGQVPIHW